jgi:hypothetical protein
VDVQSCHEKDERVEEKQDQLVLLQEFKQIGEHFYCRIEVKKID